jgi:hypothetical protein
MRTPFAMRFAPLLLALALPYAERWMPRTKPAVHPLHQPGRPARGARSLRRLPPADHPGQRAQPDGHQRDAVGRRGLQQRHPALQALHPGRGLHARRASRPAQEPGRRSRREMRAWASWNNWRRCRPGNGAAGRCVPRVRTRRSQHQLHLPGDRPAQRRPGRSSGWTSPAARTSSSPTAARHRQPDRGAGDQHHQDAPERPAPVVPGHQRPAGRLPLFRLHRLPYPYANDRDPRHSGPYAKFGHIGQASHADPTIPKDREGPPAQAPVHPRDPDLAVHGVPHAPAEHLREHLLRLHHVGLRVRRAVHVAGEAEVPRRRRDAQDPRPQPGRGGDPRQVVGPEFSRTCPSSTRSSRTPSSPTTTATAGTSARSSSATARATLLDAKGTSRCPTTTRRSSRRRCTCRVHVDVGMQCVDCHFARTRTATATSRRGGRRDRDRVQGLPRHRRAQVPHTFTPARMAQARPHGHEAAAHPGWRARFEWREGKLIQRSARHPDLEWEMSLVKDS